MVNDLLGPTKKSLTVQKPSQYGEGARRDGTNRGVNNLVFFLMGVIAFPGCLMLCMHK